MKKDDDFINENSINDLIRYAEEESDTPEESYEEETDTYDDEQTDEAEEIREEVIEEKPAAREESVYEDYANYYETEDDSGEIVFEEDKKIHEKVSVSYTHLTLPTKA